MAQLKDTTVTGSLSASGAMYAEGFEVFHKGNLNIEGLQDLIEGFEGVDYWIESVQNQFTDLNYRVDGVINSQNELVQQFDYSIQGIQQSIQQARDEAQYRIDSFRGEVDELLYLYNSIQTTVNYQIQGVVDQVDQLQYTIANINTDIDYQIQGVIDLTNTISDNFNYQIQQTTDYIDSQVSSAREYADDLINGVVGTGGQLELFQNEIINSLYTSEQYILSVISTLELSFVGSDGLLNLLEQTLRGEIESSEETVRSEINDFRLQLLNSDGILAVLEQSLLGEIENSEQSLSGQISDLSTLIIGSDGVIAQTRSEIEGRITDAENYLSGQIGSLEQLIIGSDGVIAQVYDTLRGEFNTLDSYRQAQINNLSSLLLDSDGVIAQVESSILAELYTSEQRLSGDISSLQTLILGSDGAIAQVRNEIGVEIYQAEQRLSGDISSLETVILGSDGALVQVQNQISAEIYQAEQRLSGEINSLENVLLGSDGLFVSLENSIRGEIYSAEQTLRGEIGSLETLILGSDGAIANVLNTIDLTVYQAEQRLSGDISSLQTLILGSDGAIAQVRNEIGAEIYSAEQRLSGDISSLETVILGSDGAIVQLREELSAEIYSAEQKLSGDISTLQNLILDSDGVIASLETELRGEIYNNEQALSGFINELNLVLLNSDSVIATRLSEISGEIQTEIGYVMGEITELESVLLGSNGALITLENTLRGAINTANSYTLGEISALSNLLFDSDGVIAQVYSAIETSIYESDTFILGELSRVEESIVGSGGAIVSLEETLTGLIETEEYARIAEVNRLDELYTDLDSALAISRNQVSSIKTINNNRGKRLRQSQIAAALAEIDIANLKLGYTRDGLEFSRAINELQAYTGPEGALARQLTEIDAFIQDGLTSISAEFSRVDTAIATTEQAIVNTRTDLLAEIQTEVGYGVQNAIAAATDILDSRIGYCSIGGEPTTHETETACTNAGGTWNAGVPLSTAVRNVRIETGDGQTASVSQIADAFQRGDDGELVARGGLLVNNNGRTTGFLAQINGDTNATSFDIIADNFRLGFEETNGDFTPVLSVDTQARRLVFAGDIAAGSFITDSNIADGVITGSIVRTAATGRRVVLGATNFPIWFGNQAGTGEDEDRTELNANNATFFVENNGTVNIRGGSFRILDTTGNANLSLTFDGGALRTNIFRANQEVIAPLGNFENLTATSSANFGGLTRETLSLPQRFITENHLTSSFLSKIAFLDPDAEVTGGSADGSATVNTGNTITLSPVINGGNQTTTIDVNFSFVFEQTIIGGSQPSTANPFIEFTIARNGTALIIPTPLGNVSNQLSTTGTTGRYRFTGTGSVVDLSGGEAGVERIWYVRREIVGSFSFTPTVNRYTNGGTFTFTANSISQAANVPVSVSAFEPTGSTGGLVSKSIWSDVLDKPFETIGAGLESVSGALRVDAGTIAVGTLPLARGGTGRTDGRAPRLISERTISATGDATWSVGFTGAANVSGVLTLSDSGVTAGTYGSSIASSVVTVDSKGRITSASTTTIRGATTSQTGVVQLNNTITSTSTTQAATANAVRLLNDAKVDTSRSISAGNGLTGGGDLTANRTITLGTPSTITGSTTNSVTASSHTHEISLDAADVGAVPTGRTLNIATGDGLSGGSSQSLAGNRTWTLTVDSTVVRTSRSIATGDGLSGGGNLSANRTLSVDNTVVRTSGNQIIGGNKTLTGDVSIDRLFMTDMGSNASRVGMVLQRGTQEYGIHMSQSRLHIEPLGDQGSGIVMETNGNVSFGGTVSGNGSGLTNLNAGNLSSGTVPSARLSGSYGISITGNAATATTLATARTINGTSFNGSGNITTANWGTSRTITIGGTGKAVNGSGNVSWSLTEIGAADRTLVLTGGDGIQTIGNLTANRTIAVDGTVARTDRNEVFNVMATHQVEGFLELNRRDSTNRPFRIRVYNSSTQQNNYMSFDVHNGIVGQSVETLKLNGDGSVEANEFFAEEKVTSKQFRTGNAGMEYNEETESIDFNFF